MEFQQSWGSIHFHLLDYLGKVPVTTYSTNNEIVSACVSDLYYAVNYAVADLDHFINLTYISSDKIKYNQVVNEGNKTMNLQEYFFAVVHGGKEDFNSYLESVVKSEYSVGNKIAVILGYNWVMGYFHPVIFP